MKGRPVALQWLRLENVRGFASLDLDLSSRRRTVLIGQNGTGKSTLLRAVALAMAGSDALLSLVGTPSDWIRRGASEARIAAGFVPLDGDPGDVTLIIARGDTPSDVLKRNLDGLERLDSALRHSTRNYFVAGYGASRRLGVDGVTETRPSRAASVATLFDAEARLISLRSAVTDAHYREGDKALVPLADALDRLLPDVRFAGIDRANRELMFETPDGLLPLRSLSDGLQNAIAWAGDLLFRLLGTFPDRRHPFASRGTLLVDEVDLHLHPVWQRQLFSFLDVVLPNFQFMVTTHSPLTAQQAGEGELFGLRRSDSGVVAVPFRGNPQNLLAHQLLLSPLFGIEDASSLKVEQQKHRYDELRAKPSLTTREKTELNRITTSLSSRPLWSGRSPPSRRRSTVKQGAAASDDA
jgi:hypothetical protein